MGSELFSALRKAFTLDKAEEFLRTLSQKLYFIKKTEDNAMSEERITEVNLKKFPSQTAWNSIFEWTAINKIIFQ